MVNRTENYTDPNKSIEIEISSLMTFILCFSFRFNQPDYYIKETFGVREYSYKDEYDFWRISTF